MSDTVWQGRFLTVEVEGAWEYAARRGGIGAAVIVAVTNDDELVLVEQYRVPIGRPCLELPAGLVGDDRPDESIEDAAARELEEETGYRPTSVQRLGNFCSSPGMTSETFELVRATGLVRTGDGGGEANEDITVYRVPIGDVSRFIAEKRTAGVAIDAKMLLLLGAGLF